MKRLSAAHIVFLACSAQAAPFADPTQPPTARGAAEVAATVGPRVESILIAPDRRLAVINGQQVTVGSRTATGTVARITETEVVLRSADGEQTLKLFPDVAREPGARSNKGRVK